MAGWTGLEPATSDAAALEPRPAAIVQTHDGRNSPQGGSPRPMFTITKTSALMRNDLALAARQPTAGLRCREGSVAQMMTRDAAVGEGPSGAARRVGAGDENDGVCRRYRPGRRVGGFSPSPAARRDAIPCSQSRSVGGPVDSVSIGRSSDTPRRALSQASIWCTAGRCCPLLLSQRDDGIEEAGTMSRHKAGEGGDRCHKATGDPQRERVPGRDSVEQALDESAQAE